MLFISSTTVFLGSSTPVLMRVLSINAVRCVLWVARESISSHRWYFCSVTFTLFRLTLAETVQCEDVRNTAHIIRPGTGRTFPPYQRQIMVGLNQNYDTNSQTNDIALRHIYHEKSNFWHKSSRTYKK